MEGLAEEGRQRTSAFAGGWKACKKGEESTNNEKTSFARLLFKAIAEFLCMARSGGRKMGTPQGQAQAGKNIAGALERDCC